MFHNYNFSYFSTIFSSSPVRPFFFYRDSKDLEFDFMDDEAAPTMQRVRVPASKTNTKKKTASFANVLNTIKKNKRTVQS